jgi:hypothetical protein
MIFPHVAVAARLIARCATGVDLRWLGKTPARGTIEL